MLGYVEVSVLVITLLFENNRFTIRVFLKGERERNSKDMNLSRKYLSFCLVICIHHMTFTNNDGINKRRGIYLSNKERFVCSNFTALQSTIWKIQAFVWYNTITHYFVQWGSESNKDKRRELLAVKRDRYKHITVFMERERLSSLL